MVENGEVFFGSVAIGLAVYFGLAHVARAIARIDEYAPEAEEDDAGAGIAEGGTVERRDE